MRACFEQHKRDLREFGVEHDHYSTTDSASNRDITYRIWKALVAGGHTESRPVKQLFDPVREMFLPDRFIKGECPNCHSKDQYGDSCEVCGKTYNPTDLIEPYSVVSGAKPVERESTHFFVKLANFETMLKSWLEERRAAGGLQSEVVNKLQEWFRRWAPELGRVARRAVFRLRNSGSAWKVFLWSGSMRRSAICRHSRLLRSLERKAR